MVFMKSVGKIFRKSMAFSKPNWKMVLLMLQLQFIMVLSLTKQTWKREFYHHDSIGLHWFQIPGPVKLYVLKFYDENQIFIFYFFFFREIV